MMKWFSINKLEWKRQMALLFAVSLALRLAFATLLRAWQTLPLYDETLYHASARAWAIALPLLWHGKTVPPIVLEHLYNYGVWPPLHPLLLSLPLLAGLPDACCRLIPLLLSSATTPLVWLFALPLVKHRAALIAALLHMLSPVWLAFAHYLWSESSFLFFLALSLTALVRIWHANGRLKPGMTLLAGTALGCAALCRATALPLLPLFMVVSWSKLTTTPPTNTVAPTPETAATAPTFHRHTIATAIKTTAHRFLGSLLILAAFVVIVSPWQTVLWLNEAPARPLLTTSGGYNLLLGNAPRVPDGAGSCWMLPEAAMVQRELIAYMRHTEPWARPLSGSPADLFSRNRSAHNLARYYLRQTPLKTTLQRAWHRLTFTLGPDVFLPRHLLRCLYPLKTHWVATTFTAITWCYGALLLMLCSAAPFYARINRGWRITLPLLAAATLTPVLITIGIPRLAHPALLIMLPLAGAITSGTHEKWHHGRWLAIAAALAALAIYLMAAPQVKAVI